MRHSVLDPSGGDKVDLNQNSTGEDGNDGNHPESPELNNSEASQPLNTSRNENDQSNHNDHNGHNEQRNVSQRTAEGARQFDGSALIHAARCPYHGRQDPDDDDQQYPIPPQVPSPEHLGTVVLRRMPRDNSCLFHAVGKAVLGMTDAVTDLRQSAANGILNQPSDFNELILGCKPAEYAAWIQVEGIWGGFIELVSLSNVLDVGICSIDVRNMRVDKYNVQAANRCFIVYSGSHFDVIALSPSSPPHTQSYASPESDTTMFDSQDELILDRALELTKILNEQGYYSEDEDDEDDDYDDDDDDDYDDDDDDDDDDDASRRVCLIAQNRL
ncbi:ubiquitin-specific protease otu1 [Ascosphaera aggregata]|nr:ubiquitin-specific protease otu1 [Ascosphaera aggregata]